MNRFLIIALGIILAGCFPKSENPSEIRLGKSLDSLTAGVACAHPEAAKIGAEVLLAGGNAFDAAVAVQWALAVCYPEAGNLGGGGFAVLRRNDGLTAALDFRERAPMKAFRDMYLDASGKVVEGTSRNTRLAAGVPGSVAGIYVLHDKFGTVPMDQLIAPAVRLARVGFPLTATQAENLNRSRDDFIERNRFQTAFVKEGGWLEGDTLVQEDLAKTLERIQKKGPTEFYRGVTAELILDEMDEGRGLIAKADLGNYRPQWRKPVTFELESYRFISVPPPSSGGIALEQLFKMAEILKPAKTEHNSAGYIHLNVEMQRRVYADRSRYLGDPDYYEVPYAELTDSTYLAERVRGLGPLATPSESVAPGALRAATESMETTHLSVVDSSGNAVSVTTTLNGRYGSKIVVKEAGFLLNNEMDDFSVKPGVPNMFGLIGGSANAIEPGKRMLSSMTPTIVERDGELFMVVGSPGGSTIITSVYQTIANAIFYDMNLEQAIAAPKFHSQWLPDKVFLEEGRFDKETKLRLRAAGHQIDSFPTLGRVDALKVSPNGKLEACGDPRGDDVAAGY
jgi:gamma-glutamyltranspeptidase/glutathione hydrolase